MQGTKRWLLYPPSRSTYSTVPVFDFLRGDYTTLPERQRPIELLQRQGEILVLPSWYGHSTVCIGDCMALSRVLENTFFDSVRQLAASTLGGCWEAVVVWGQLWRVIGRSTEVPTLLLLVFEPLRTVIGAAGPKHRILAL